MSDEEYQSREGTYRSWKMEQLRKNPKWTVEQHMAEKRGEVWVGPRQKQQHGGRHVVVLELFSPSVPQSFSPRVLQSSLESLRSRFLEFLDCVPPCQVASITIPATCHPVTCGSV